MTDPFTHLAAALADRYTLDRLLGRGGMAVVYLAEDLRHHRKVAVKVLLPELAAALGPARFLREIETTAQLRHPHLLPIFESGAAEGFLYYVMPLVEGESLRDRLEREKQLPIPEAITIAREVADALGYAHARGVVHRDIKPENILLESGHAVVADFGIARAVTSAGEQTLTATGIVVGTPAYMSPEQAAGNDGLDGRSDLYSLGCVLYEMLAGQPPFSGPTVASIVGQHVAAEPRPVTALRPSVPSPIAEALNRALAKAPADRFENAARFATALAEGGRPTGKRLPWRGWAVGLAAVGVAVTVSLLLPRSRTPEVELGRRMQVTLDPGVEMDPALSPDGKFLAYSGPGGMLQVRLVDNGPPLAVVRGADGRGRFPVWLPNGQSLVFVSSRGIEVVSALGGVPRLLVAGPNHDRGVAVSPDGRLVAFASHDSLFRQPLDGGPPSLIAVGREIHSFSWSPDGRWIAFVSGNIQYISASDLGNVAHSSIWLAPAEGGQVAAITDDRAQNVSPAWLGSQTLLFLSDRNGGQDIYRVDLDRRGVPKSEPVRFTTGLSAMSISVSLDGSRLAYTDFSETSNVWSVAIPAAGTKSASEATPITIGNQVVENFDISFDGRAVAYEAVRSGVAQLYWKLLGEPDAQERQLTTDTVNSYWVAWSPDGKALGFHRFRGERRVAFVIGTDAGAATPVSDGTDDERSPEWSPDGHQLLTLANWGTKPELHLFERTGARTWSGPRRFPVIVGSDTVVPGISSWSPDGRLLACGCGEGGLVIAPLDGSPARRLASPFSTAGWAFPQWSSDGRTVYHITEENGRTTGIVAVPTDGSAPRLVLRFDDPARPWHRFGFRVRAGRLFFTLGDQQSDVWAAELRRP